MKKPGSLRAWPARVGAPPLLIAILCFGCSDEPVAAERAAPAAPTENACASDERRADDGACELASSPSDCPAGTRPAVGVDVCVPVGTTTCAPGFERDASGWGCAPIMAEAPCVGATRPRLGERQCVPVGDCDAPYPPRGAVIVDASLPGEAIDAFHVRTLADALATAADGATIALADGSHETQGVTLTKPASIVGRCPARTRLVPSSPAGPGLIVRAQLSLRGLLLDGHTETLRVVSAGALTAEDIVIENARSRAILALSGASVVLRRSVVRGTSSPSRSAQTVAVLAGTRAKLDIDDSAILVSVDAALAVTDDPATRAVIKRTIVQDTLPRPDGVGGGALRAFEGAHLDVSESAIIDAVGAGIFTMRRDGPPPEVRVERSVIRRTTASPESPSPVGITAGLGALVYVDESTISDSEGHGVYAGDGASIALTKSVIARFRQPTQSRLSAGLACLGGAITVDGSAIVDVGSVGVSASKKGRITLRSSLVSNMGGDVIQGVPVGQTLHSDSGGAVDAVDSAAVNGDELGFSASQDGSSIHLERVFATRSKRAPTILGHAAVAIGGASFDIDRSIIEGHPGAALLVGAARGSVRGGSLIRGNAIGAHAQEGATLVTAKELPAPIPLLELVIADDTRFVGNMTRFGSGTLPLPRPILEP